MIRTDIKSSSPATQFWRQKVLEVANDHRDITFAIASEQDFENELKDFGLDDSGEEINVGCFDDKNRKYRMEPDEEFDEDSLREFVENFKKGKMLRGAWYGVKHSSAERARRTWVGREGVLLEVFWVPCKERHFTFSSCERRKISECIEYF